VYCYFHRLTFHERFIYSVSTVAELPYTADQYTAFLTTIVTRVFYITLYYRIADYTFCGIKTNIGILYINLSSKLSCCDMYVFLLFLSSLLLLLFIYNVVCFWCFVRYMLFYFLLLLCLMRLNEKLISQNIYIFLCLVIPHHV